MTAEKEASGTPEAGTKRSCALPGALLIVDDSPDEAGLAKRILTEMKVRNPVQIVFGGNELIAYLHGSDEYEDRTRYPFPILILLDLKMPGMDGLEILRWLRSRPEYGSIPVVVLSGVEDTDNITRAYQFGARTFLRKPLATVALQQMAEALSIPLQF